MASQRDNTEGEPKRNSGDDKKKFEKVVDELRNVLASLNGTTVPNGVSMTPPPADALPPETSFIRPPSPLAPPTMEPEKMGEAAFRQAAGLENPTPTDQEFWNGNVLGWPTATPPVEEPEEEPLMTEPPEMPAETPEAPKTSLEDRVWLDDHMANDVPQIFPSSSPPARSGSRIELPPEETSYDDLTLPPAPTPPGMEEEPVEESAAESGIVFGNFAPMVDINEPTEDDASTEANRSILPANLKIPIPGTLNQLPQGNKPNSPDPTLEEMDIHHGHVFSVACIFPDGRELEAEEFLKRLKASLATSAHADIRVDAVLKNPWSMGKVNTHAWKKAASLSGANYLFVLAPRKDREQFKEIGRLGHKDEVRSRLIFIEQVSMRTLYADLLADVLRSMNVKD